jgi:hypothetical protein
MRSNVFTRSVLGSRRWLFGRALVAAITAVTAKPAIEGEAAAVISRKRKACADGRDRCNGRCCKVGQSCDAQGGGEARCTRKVTCGASQAVCAGLCCTEDQVCVRVRHGRSYCAAPGCASDPCSCCTEGQVCQFSEYFNLKYCADPDCDPDSCGCLPWGPIC